MRGRFWAVMIGREIVWTTYFECQKEKAIEAREIETRHKRRRTEGGRRDGWGDSGEGERLLGRCGCAGVFEEFLLDPEQVWLAPSVGHFFTVEGGSTGLSGIWYLGPKPHHKRNRVVEVPEQPSICECHARPFVCDRTNRHLPDSHSSSQG